METSPWGAFSSLSKNLGSRVGRWPDVGENVVLQLRSHFETQGVIIMILVQHNTFKWLSFRCTAMNLNTS